MNLSQLFKLIENELSKDLSSNKVLDYKEPNEMKEILNLDISDGFGSEEEMFASIDNYIKGSVDTSHPLFSNQLWSGRNYPALVGEFITSLRNTSVYTYETAPAATIIESFLIDFLCKKIGFGEGDGTFLTGSSNANLISLLVARNTLFPETKSKGTHHLPELCFFISEHAHYSFEKAANVLGIGENNVIKIKTDKDFKMLPNDLEIKINESISLGKKPFYVCGTAGTTEHGAFDPLPELQEVAKKYGLWFHTDGAWGGALIFSEKHKHLLEGVENSDSVAWDAHKLMGVPLICSVILLKSNSQLLSAVEEHTSDYLFHENEFEDLDLGRKSIQCGRRVDSLKLWLSLKYFGLKGYEERIERLINLAQYMTDKVKENPNLELLAPTTYCNVNFRYKPENELSSSDINKINLNARQEIYKDGIALFNYCYIDNVLSIRYTFTNPEVMESDLDYILSVFVDKCKVIIS